MPVLQGSTSLDPAAKNTKAAFMAGLLRFFALLGHYLPLSA